MAHSVLAAQLEDISRGLEESPLEEHLGNISGLDNLAAIYAGDSSALSQIHAIKGRILLQEYDRQETTLRIQDSLLLAKSYFWLQSARQLNPDSFAPCIGELEIYLALVGSPQTPLIKKLRGQVSKDIELELNNFESAVESERKTCSLAYHLHKAVLSGIIHKEDLAEEAQKYSQICEDSSN